MRRLVTWLGRYRYTAIAILVLAATLNICGR